MFNTFQFQSFVTSLKIRVYQYKLEADVVIKKKLSGPFIHRADLIPFKGSFIGGISMF